MSRRVLVRGRVADLLLDVVEEARVIEGPTEQPRTHIPVRAVPRGKDIRQRRPDRNLDALDGIHHE